MDSEVQKGVAPMVISLVAAFIGLSIYAVFDANSRYVKRLDAAEKSGRRAYDLGVPAEANPFVGEAVFHSQKWLEGWLAAKESSLANDK